MIGTPNPAKISQRQDAAARGVIAVLCAAVLVFALLNVSLEFSANKARTDGAMGPYRSANSNLDNTVRSVEGVYAKLDACDAALSALLTRLQPQAQRLNVAQDCLVFANRVLDQAPAMSFAHLVKAVALVEQGDTDAARLALQLSEQTAGTNIFHAQRRAALWSKYFETLSPTEKDALARDFVKMAATPRGAAWLAGQYQVDLEMRDFITATVQTLPDARQAAFLSALRRLNQ